jgi:hypothetical protein
MSVFVIAPKGNVVALPFLTIGAISLRSIFGPPSPARGKGFPSGEI